MTEKKESPVETPVVEVAPAEPVAPEAPAKKLATDAEMEQVTKTTAQLLKEQDQVKVRLYLPQEERKKLEAAKAAGLKVEWPFEFVSINGYNYQIQKGIDVEVPQSVKEILEEAGLI